MTQAIAHRPDLTAATYTSTPTVAHLHAVAPPARRAPRLSPREQRVLSLVAEGYSTREVAQRLHYSERTIKNVLQSVGERLNCRNRTHAAVYAVRHGWI